MVEDIFVNLTPNTVIVLGENGERVLEVPPSGKVARVVEDRMEKAESINGVPTVCLHHTVHATFTSTVSIKSPASST